MIYRRRRTLGTTPIHASGAKGEGKDESVEKLVGGEEENGGIGNKGGEEGVNGVEEEEEEEEDRSAAQCIWIARVRPEDCEKIIKFTVLQGKVVKPERQLRGGFDRERGLVSW